MGLTKGEAEQLYILYTNGTSAWYMRGIDTGLRGNIDREEGKQKAHKADSEFINFMNAITEIKK